MSKRITNIDAAREAAAKAKREVYKLVDIASDFSAIPWFKTEITPQEGVLLWKQCERFPGHVEAMEKRPDRCGVRINGVWFWWENIKENMVRPKMYDAEEKIILKKIKSRKTDVSNIQLSKELTRSNKQMEPKKLNGLLFRMKQEGKIQSAGHGWWKSANG